MVAANALKNGVFVVAAKRTPFGTFGGSLKGHSPTDLSVRSLPPSPAPSSAPGAPSSAPAPPQVIASNAAIQSSGLSPEHISSVCIG